MIGLLSSELLRARSRRVVPMMIVGAVFGVLVGVVIGTVVADPGPAPEQVEQAQRRYDRTMQRCLDGGFTSDLEGTEFTTFEAFCAEYVEPQVSGLKFADLGDLLDGTATMVILLGALLGSTLGGADWSAGTMTTLLTWEPRRLRVFVARAIVVTAVVLVITVVAQVWLSLAIAGAVAVKGTFAFTPDGFVGDIAVAIARVSGVAAAFGLIGLSFATVGRSTVAAVGALLGYLVLVEGFIAAWVFGVAKVSLGRAATVAATHRSLQIDNPRPPRGAPPEQVRFLLEPGRAWVTLAVWVAVLCVIAVLTFRARDVT